MSSTWEPRKVVIIRARAVSSTFAYVLAQSSVADGVGLLDANHELAMGQFLDLVHSQAVFPSVQLREAQPADCASAHFIVIAAGAKQRQEESRLELVRLNTVIMQGITDEIVHQRSLAVILVVSNPVDILTYVAHKRSGRPPRRILGSGTVLDSARFRHLLRHHCGEAVHNVHVYILGKHGDSEFAAWSMTNMAGMPIAQSCRLRMKCDDRRATRFAVGLALARIAAAILRNQHCLHTESSVLEGEYGLRGVSLEVPCIVSSKGVEQVQHVTLPQRNRMPLNGPPPPCARWPNIWSCPASHRDKAPRNRAMQQQQTNPERLNPATVAKAGELVNCLDGAVGSREIVKKPTRHITLCAFEADLENNNAVALREFYDDRRQAPTRNAINQSL